MNSLLATFPTAAEFIAAWDAELSKGGLLVRGATVESAVAGGACLLTVQIVGRPAVQIEARLAAVIPGVGVAVMFDGTPPALAELNEQVRSGTPPQAEDSEAGSDHTPGSLFERLKAMTVAEKTQLALSGGRDERMALLRDPLKPVHIFVLKNPRVGIDEVQHAAKQANLSPDALKFIAEHRDWGMNAQVCTALVRNPKTPMPLALKALERIPANDLKAIAKGGARDQLVQSARKRLAERR